MNKASHQFEPFLIKMRVRENNGTWGHWKVHSRFWQEELRDAEFAKKKNREFVEYERTVDMAELDGQLRAMERMK